MKNLKRDIPGEDGSFPACSVFKLVVMTRLTGQIIEAGQTSILRDRPARPNPPICADMERSIAKLAIFG